MMALKKIMSLFLAFVLLFAGLPAPLLPFSGTLPVFAEVPPVDILYGDFTSTGSLELNGSGLIDANGAIRFDSMGGSGEPVTSGESVFTSGTVTLDTNLAFSTAFTFQSTSPATPVAGTEGGFTFTLQSAGNTMVTNTFQHETIQPSLSVAFVTVYMDSPATAKLYKLKNFAIASVADIPINDLLTASLPRTKLQSTDMSIAELPPVRSESTFLGYLNGAYDVDSSLLNGYLGDGTHVVSGDYHVWIGYDGEMLTVLCRNPGGEYAHSSLYMTPAELGLPSSLHAGFMGSIGNAGNTTAISSWSFKNDTSLLDQAFVDADTVLLDTEMNLIESSKIESDLPIYGQYGSDIIWTTSNPMVVTTGGAVTVPTLEQGDQVVELSATVTKGIAVPRTTRTYHCVVPVPDDVIVDADYDWLTEEIILVDNTAVTEVVSNLHLPDTGLNGSSISWSSSNTALASWSGNVGNITRPAYPATDQTITLTATFDRFGMWREKTFEITILALGATAADITGADDAWLTASELLNGNASLNDVTTDLTLPIVGQYESSISWASNNISAVGMDGKVTRPTYTAGDATATLTATITKVIESDTSTVTKTFPVTVRKLEQTDAEKILADKTWLTEAQLLNGNASLSQITQNLTLPTIAPKGSTITWASSNSGVVGTNGTVTRPTYSQGDKTVTLAATITSGALSDGKEFTATVLKLAETDAEKIIAAKTWLTDAQLLHAEDESLSQITKPLTLPTTAPNGSAISWATSNSVVVSSNGTVTRPSFTQGDQTVTLTATITSGLTSDAKAFAATVLKLPQTDAEKLEADEAWLTDVRILNGNPLFQEIIGDLSLPTEAPNGSVLSWTSDANTIVDAAGSVTRPSFTNGEATVTLTAILSLNGLTVTKTYVLTVKALAQTDEEAVQAALPWLTEYMTSINGNLAQVTLPLTLPTSGPNGVAIGWASGDPAVVGNTGQVTRPTFTVGDKTVVLTATLTRGPSAAMETTFAVTVLKRDQSALERVLADAAWLTESQILNGNASLANITQNFALPTSGPNGSTISWYSTDNSFWVTVEGVVKRPAYTVGGKSVTLTATIRSGVGTSERKTFLLTLTPLPITDAEIAYLDTQWLWRYPILNGNPTANAVTADLSFPAVGPNMASISWQSDAPSVIAADGHVQRPEHGQGHKAVQVIATITAGALIRTYTYSYVVLEAPDTVPPAVMATTPENNAANLPFDTNRITVTYGEPIFRGPASAENPQTLGIEIQASDAVGLAANIEGATLTITPNAALRPGENRILIPAGAVADAAGNATPATQFVFFVEPKLVRTIRVLSTTPQDVAKDVETSLQEIKIRFDMEGLTLNNSYLMMVRSKTTGLIHANVRSLVGDTATLTVVRPFQPGTVYEIVVPAGVVRDRFGNGNEQVVRSFRTKQNTDDPKVVGSSPANGQTGVNCNQAAVEVTFSKEVGYLDHKLTLRDEAGRLYTLTAYRESYRTSTTNQMKLLVNGLSTFRPNTTYTLSGPYDAMEGESGMEFQVRFTTSANGLMLARTSPSAGGWNVPLDAAVEVTFETLVAKGASFSDISIKDSGGNAIGFVGGEVGGNAILKPVSPLSPAETYTVIIPAGAYHGEGNTRNDAYQFHFSTVQRIALTERHITVPETGLHNKPTLLDASAAETVAKSFGHRIVSYDWRVDGVPVFTTKLGYHLFRTVGSHVVKLLLRDSQGIEYAFTKTIVIEPLSGVRMTLRDSEYAFTTILNDFAGAPQSSTYELNLVRNGQFIRGEHITVELFKNGVPQRVLKSIASINDSYPFSFTPKPGENGLYELEFAYEGVDGTQHIRVPVQVYSRQPVIAKAFSFRLYDLNTGGYHEGPESLAVTVGDQPMQAVKRWNETISGYVYTLLNQSLPANTYHAVEVEAWKSERFHQNVYVGTDGSAPFIIKGRTVKPGGIKSVRVDEASCTIQDPNFRNLFFEDVSAKWALRVEGDWKGADAGYYELKAIKDVGAWYSEDGAMADDGFSLKVNCTDREGAQTILLDPGLQLRAGEQFLIRMVTKQGIASNWYYTPIFEVITQPSLMGKDLPVSIHSGEYAVRWPTVFDGAMGATIGFLDGIPVIGGGNFGIGSGMPNFEGALDGNVAYPMIDLDFGASGDYGQDTKTKTATKYKKLKKVSVVGYEFSIELEGACQLSYNTSNQEWSVYNFFISLNGDLVKEWSKGYEFMGVGFTAGVGIGGELYGALNVDNRNRDPEYSGIIRITPKAHLRVSGDFAVARVDGYLNARLPAEIHFPTGYIGADVDVSANIYAQALLWGKTIYEKRLYHAHWDNEKNKVVIGSLQDEMRAFASRDFASLEVVSREYLNRSASWKAGDTAFAPEQMGAGVAYRNMPVFLNAANENPTVRVSMENIYPDAEIQSVRNGAESWLVWTDDNPDRDAVNRTQLRYSVLKGGAWSSPAWFHSDGTADFDPAVAAAGEGVLMAWHNIGRTVTEEDGLAGMLAQSEISVTGDVLTADGTPNVIQLTNDEAIDHSPRLAASGETALLVWTKSTSLGFDMGDEATSEPSVGNQLFASSWQNGIWSDPEPIGDTSRTVVDSSLAMTGEEGLLLYTLELDNDLFTYADREIYARLYQGGAWGEAIRLTDNALDDAAPKAVYAGGQWFITWLQEGNIRYRLGLRGETRAVDALLNIQGDYRLAVQPGVRPLVALTSLQPGEDRKVGVSSYFFDVDNGQWGEGVVLAGGNKHAKAISTVFTETGKLNVVFSQADVVTEAVPVMVDGVEQLIEQPSVSDRVDMQLLSYTPVHDVALSEAEGLLLSTEFPLPGTLTTVYATIVNEGDFAENTRVLLYDGNPEQGGALIAQTSSMRVPARTSKEVEIPWLVGPESKNQYDLYAVALAEEEFHEANADNNTLRLQFSTSDLSVAGLTCENEEKDTYLVTLTVANSGGKALEGAMVFVENTGDGAVLETATLGHLEPGERTVLTYRFTSSGLARDDKGEVRVRARIVPPAGIQEEFTDNNVRSVLLAPSPLVVTSLFPGPAERHVTPESTLRLDFNLNVEEGAGFDHIRLLDERLNEMALGKHLEANTLTLTPLQNMEPGTEYTLTIPVDALGDAYGHELGQAFHVTFTTTPPNPEIIAAYPGESMQNTPLDTEMVLTFNQPVQAGYAYDNIVLRENGKGAIPVRATLNGSALTLAYAGRLMEDTRYTLEVPRGVVQNQKGEVMGEDYQLAFTTIPEGQGTPAPSPSGSGDADDTQPHASIEVGGVRQTVSVRQEAGTAIVNIGTLASDIFRGDKEVAIQIPNMSSATAYLLEMPADVLGTAGQAALTIHSAFGSVRVPAGMLSTMGDLKGKTVGILMAAVNPSTLPAELRGAIGDKPVLRITVRINGEGIAWRNPQTPVWVSIPYTPTPAEVDSPESLVIWYIDGNNQRVSVPSGRYDAAAGEVTFKTTHLSQFAVAYHKVDFEDVSKNSWYAKAVSFLAAREITLGTAPDTFSPDTRLTRGQFIVMLMRAYSLEADANPTDNFSDAGTTYYTHYLSAAKRLGISNGVGSNRFAPDTEITRQEMMTMVYNALKAIDELPAVLTEGKMKMFTDADEIADWARTGMATLVEAGIVNGSGNSLLPGAKSTRAQMAQILYNLLVMPGTVTK